MPAFADSPGRLPSGSIRPGDAVMALPSGRKSRVRSIVTRDGDESEAFAPMSVTVTLEDEIDVSRGDMLVSPENPPQVSRHFEAMVVWFDEQPLALGRTYLVKHTVRSSRVKATEIEYRVEMGALKQEPAQRVADERHWRSALRGGEPAFLRSVRGESHHGQLHSDRSADERDGGRGHDSPRRLSAGESIGRRGCGARRWRGRSVTSGTGIGPRWC